MIVGVIADRRVRPSESVGVTRFSIVLPDTQIGTSNLTEVRHLIALSPDGTKLAYIANSTNGQLYIRQMSEMQARPMAGAVFESGTRPWLGESVRGRALLSFCHSRIDCRVR